MEKVIVTQEQADVLFEIARMSKGIPAKTLISALENGFDIESEAEAKKRRWWAKHGRDVDQYKPNDVIRESYNQAIREVSYIENDTVYMKCGGGFGKEVLKIVCFAEDRKDA